MPFFTTSNQSKIFYSRSGNQGRPPVVFIHGFTCDSTHWNNQVRFFEADYDVVTLDLGAHGQSHADIEHCGIQTYGEDVIALFDHLALQKPILVGHSMGCRVALCAAGLRTDRIAGLALIDSGLIGTKENLDEVLKKVDQATQAMGHKALVRVMFEAMFFDNADEGLKRQVIANADAFDEEIGAKLGPNIITWEATEMESMLERLSMPLLGVCSTKILENFARAPLTVDERDEWVTLMQEKAPQIKIVNLPNTGHFVMQERPAELNQLLSDFFQRT